MLEPHLSPYSCPLSRPSPQPTPAVPSPLSLYGPISPHSEKVLFTWPVNWYHFLRFCLPLAGFLLPLQLNISGKVSSYFWALNVNCLLSYHGFYSQPSSVVLFKDGLWTEADGLLPVWHKASQEITCEYLEMFMARCHCHDIQVCDTCSTRYRPVWVLLNLWGESHVAQTAFYPRATGQLTVHNRAEQTNKTQLVTSTDALRSTALMHSGMSSSSTFWDVVGCLRDKCPISASE